MVRLAQVGVPAQMDLYLLEMLLIAFVKSDKFQSQIQGLIIFFFFFSVWLFVFGVYERGDPMKSAKNSLFIWKKNEKL